MKEVKVLASTPYSVYIEKNSIEKVGDYLQTAIKKPIKVLVVTDENVSALYLKKVVESLQKSGYKTFTCILKAGEGTKSMENFSKLCSVSASLNLTREDALLALGGGVIGDLVGFTASCYMRGIKFIQVPTTLLAAIDSSVGGKTAINIEEGKNLIGSFWQPCLVVYDPETRKTLPKEQFLCGVGEAVKYAVLAGGRIYDILSSGKIDENFEELVELCVIEKAKIVHQDEKEHGVRKLLNLGHTVGHAIEKLSNFTALHGLCVAKGLYLLAKAQRFEGSISEDCFNKIEKMLNTYAFDLEITYSVEDIVKEFVYDKKSVDGGVSLVKIKDIGDCFVENTAIDCLGEFLSCK